MNETISTDKIIAAVQCGDYSYVINCIENHSYSVNLIDNDGCSLLHWAAINNRYDIVKYLVDHNANVNITGGILVETPLQWSVRYDTNIQTVLLLLNEGHSDINIKSKNGSDVLFIACQYQAMNNIFILLDYMKCNVNTINNDGDTPLYWLLKYKCKESLDIQRLLLQYQANTSYLDKCNNNSLHVVLSNGIQSDVYSIIIIYNSLYKIDSNNIFKQTNDEGKTPIDIAKELKIEHIIALLNDLSMFHSLPRYIVTIISAFFIVNIYITIYLLKPLYAFPILVLSYLLYDYCNQSMIITELSRQSNGMAWGVIISIIGSYYIFLANKLSLVHTLIVTLFMVTISYSLYTTSITSPHSITRQQQEMYYNTNIVDRLIHSNKKNKYKLCSSCIIEKSQVTTHCAQCNRCVLSLDHHCVFVDNCVGYGNRRIFLVFTISASLGCLYYFIVCLYVTYTYYCPYAEGILGNMIAKEWCIVSIHPTICLIKWLAFLCSIWIGGISINQLLLIASETTTYEVMKGLTHIRYSSCCTKSGIQNIFYFFLTGKYKSKLFDYNTVTHINNNNKINKLNHISKYILSAFNLNNERNSDREDNNIDDHSNSVTISSNSYVHHRFIHPKSMV